MIIIFNDSPQYPNRSVGAYRIATVLRRQDLEVEVIDYLHKWETAHLNNKPDPERLFDYLDKIPNVEWWGFSGKFLSAFSTHSKNQFPGLKPQKKLEGHFTKCSMEYENKLIQYIRNRGGSIVVGGPATDVLKIYCEESNIEQDYKKINFPLSKKIDILCEGYADVGVIAIHEHIMNNADLKYTDLNGVKVVNCDTDYNNIDLATLDTEYDSSDFLLKEEVFPIEIGRGCIFHCAFCSFGHLGKKPGTYIRPKESIKKDIVDRYEKYGTTRFLFVDDTFNDSVEKMKIIKEIRDETGIPFEFWSYCRLDLLRAKPEMVDLINDIGWTSFTFGVETFNKASGKDVKKGADPEKLKEFLITLRERFPKNKFHINFIVGLPSDTEEEITESVQWFIDHPTVATNLTIRELNIHNARHKRTASLIAQNPESYGYTVSKSNSNPSLVNWVTKKGMTLDFATKLSKQLQETYYRSVGKAVTPVTVMMDDILDVDETGMLVNNQGEVIKSYLRNKRKYRGLDKDKPSIQS
jgi:hypothetical protein